MWQNFFNSSYAPMTILYAMTALCLCSIVLWTYTESGKRWLKAL